MKVEVLYRCMFVSAVRNNPQKTSLVKRTKTRKPIIIFRRNTGCSFVAVRCTDRASRIGWHTKSIRRKTTYPC